MPRNRKPDADPIRVSELVEFTYCHQAWWLRRQGYVPQRREALRRGQAYHRGHARRLVGTLWLRRAAWLLWALALVLALMALLGNTG